MSAFTTIAVVGAIAWGVQHALRRVRSASQAGTPAWAGDPEAPPPPGSLAASFPSLAAPVRRSADDVPMPSAPMPRDVAAESPVATAASAALPSATRHTFSSQPQRRRPDRSARLFARARGPGLCSPRTRP